MAKTNSTRPIGGSTADNTVPIASLRFLAAAFGQLGNTPLNDEEAYGIEVLLNMVADKLEGGNQLSRA